MPIAQIIAERIKRAEQVFREDDYQDLTPILNKAMTVGELLEKLKNCDQHMPVLLEVYDGLSEEGSLQSKQCYLIECIELRKSYDGYDGANGCNLTGCTANVFEDYSREILEE